MHQGAAIFTIVAALWVFSSQSSIVSANSEDGRARNIQVGPRPYYLVEDLDPGKLKTELQQCREKSLKKTDFSIGHRGAALQFPEHTKESYEAAARMGAGIVECDVTFTKDKELVCRHSQCDLHTTTDILATPLASKCSVPFSPANPSAGTPAQALCCTSNIPWTSLKHLRARWMRLTPTRPLLPNIWTGTPTGARICTRIGAPS